MGAGGALIVLGDAVSAGVGDIDGFDVSAMFGPGISTVVNSTKECWSDGD